MFLALALKEKKIKAQNTVVLIYSPDAGQNITLRWGRAINYILSSPDCTPDLILAPPLYYFALQFLPHACRPARMPKLCCCVPADQQACRPVQERAIERKRGGSQLRLGNGRLNTSWCVRRAYVLEEVPHFTSSGCKCTCSGVCMCAPPVAAHIAKLNLAGSGF